MIENKETGYGDAMSCGCDFVMCHGKDGMESGVKQGSTGGHPTY